MSEEKGTKPSLLTTICQGKRELIHHYWPQSVRGKGTKPSLLTTICQGKRELKHLYWPQSVTGKDYYSLNKLIITDNFVSLWYFMTVNLCKKVNISDWIGPHDRPV